MKDWEESCGDKKREEQSARAGKTGNTEEWEANKPQTVSSSDTRSTSPSSSLAPRDSPTWTSVSVSRVVVTSLSSTLSDRLSPRVSLRK